MDKPKVDPLTGEVSPDFAKKLEDLKRDVAEKEAEMSDPSPPAIRKAQKRKKTAAERESEQLAEEIEIDSTWIEDDAEHNSDSTVPANNWPKLQRAQNKFFAKKYKPPKRVLDRPVYRDAALEERLREFSCDHVGCAKGRAREGKELTWPLKAQGLPIVHCFYCKEEFSPVDLGIMSEEQADKIVEELHRNMIRQYGGKA